MSQSKYTKVVETGYAMLKMIPPPSGFGVVHLTISVQDGNRISPDDLAWKLPHFTMKKMDWMYNPGPEVKIYLYESGSGFDLITKDRTAFSHPDPDFEALAKQMLRDGAVISALRDQERFVLFGL